MKAERLNWVAHEVYYELRHAKVGRHFSDLLAVAEVLMGSAPEASPTLPEPIILPDGTTVATLSREQAAAHLTSILEDLGGSLERVPSNGFPPSDAGMLRAIGVWSLTGERLWERIEATVNQGGVDSQATLEQLRLLHEDYSNMHSALSGLVKAFRGLGIAQQGPSAEGAEIGVITHLKIDEITLRELNDELKQLERYLAVFPEIVGEPGRELRVRGVSNEFFFVSFAVAFKVAIAVAAAITWLLATLDRALSIRLKMKGLQDDGADIHQGADETVKDFVDSRIDELREELLETYDQHQDPEEDQGRRNEVSNLLDRALRFMIGRMEQGAEFEVRMIAPSEPETELALTFKGIRTFADLQAKGAAMRDRQLPRERILNPSLLAPPDPEEDEESEPEEADDPSADAGPKPAQKRKAKKKGKPKPGTTD